MKNYLSFANKEAKSGKYERDQAFIQAFPFVLIEIHARYTCFFSVGELV
jgi:hypothetical protein